MSETVVTVGRWEMQKLPALAEALRRFLGTTLRHWPMLWRQGRCEKAWLHRLLVGAHGSPPLHHLLLKELLSAMLRV